MPRWTRPSCPLLGRARGGCHRSGELLDQTGTFAGWRTSVRRSVAIWSDREPRLPHELSDANLSSERFRHASDDTGSALIDYCFMRCSRLRLTDPSQFIKSAWIRPEDLAVYEAMGYTNFKLLERGIPSAELLRRVKAYSERRFDGNLAELLLSYGFKQPVRKESLWNLRHFLKPRQVNPLRLKPMLDLARLQGWLSPLPECPIRVECAKKSRRISWTVFATATAPPWTVRLALLRADAAQAVSISPGYRAEVLESTRNGPMPWQREGSGVFDSRATATEFLDRPDCDPALPPPATGSWRRSIVASAASGSSGAFSGRRILRGRPAAPPWRVLRYRFGKRCDIPLR